MTSFLKIIFSLLLISSLVHANEYKYKKSTQTCQKFAQDFYSWYLPFLVKHGYGVTLKTIIKKKQDLFDGPLLQMLLEDHEAQSKFMGDLVGIDWDPFLNTQDPAQKYTVQNTSVLHDNCDAETWSGRTLATKDPKPDVIAKLKWVDGGWKFVNFDDPTKKSSIDLISALEEMRRAREKNQK
jgi:hypothetical protein